MTVLRLRQEHTLRLVAVRPASYPWSGTLDVLKVCIISEEAVRGLGIHIEELGKALNIVTASDESLSIVGVADVFIKVQVTGEHRMMQCCILRGHKQAPEILVSLERMKALRIIHPTFGKETIDDYLLKNENKSYSKYSERYVCNSVQYYKPPKSSFREPSEEEAKLRDKMIKRFPNCFVDKLGPEDRVNCRPIKLEVDEREAEALRPVSHIGPFDVPYHLRESFQEEICDMLNAGVIEKREVSTKWNTKAFPIPKAGW